MPVVINGTTGISGIDGSAASPAIEGTDTNTGMFFPAADTIGFTVGGVEELRIGPAGQIGIQGANYGTSGQVLASGGASASPSWANVATPKLDLIGTINVGTGTSASLSGLNLTGYNFVNLYFNGVSNNADGSYLVGTSTADDVTATPAVLRANTLIGYMVINLLDGTGFFSSSAGSLAFDTPVVKASTSISVANSTGNFDAGSILVYGVS